MPVLSEIKRNPQKTSFEKSCINISLQMRGMCLIGTMLKSFVNFRQANC